MARNLVSSSLSCRPGLYIYSHCMQADTPIRLFLFSVAFEAINETFILRTECCLCEREEEPVNEKSVGWERNEVEKDFFLRSHVINYKARFCGRRRSPDCCCLCEF
jgi:hypothetical protein